MHPVPRLNLVEQTALHLQRGIKDGRWKGALPGVLRLAGELGVSKDTVEAALRSLEAQGWIASRGPGRRREVVARRGWPKARRSLRIGLLLRDDLEKSVPLTQELFLKLIHDLEAAGHMPVLAPKSQGDLGLDPRRIGRMVEKCAADAWVLSGSPGEVLDWFHRRDKPYMVLGGRVAKYPEATAAINPAKAIHDTVARLIRLGHRRIVLVCLPDWVRPPGPIVTAFTRQMEAAGLPVSEYNLPHHETTPKGCAKMLESLFRLTPPTAMIVPHMHYAFAVMGFLGARGLSVPRDVSLVSRSPDPAFAWVRPRIAHFHCPIDPLLRRILRWVDACAKGTPDYEGVVVDAELVPGETMVVPPTV